ncbi:MAG TPA: hypothetical protein DHU96_04400 [Actinobacteria bacterium]|nr:hypothetical protein [Actinomycetota bacterium]
MSGSAGWWVLRSQVVNASSQDSFQLILGGADVPAVHHIDVDDPHPAGGDRQDLGLLGDGIAGEPAGHIGEGIPARTSLPPVRASRLLLRGQRRAWQTTVTGQGAWWTQ